MVYWSFNIQSNVGKSLIQKHFITRKYADKQIQYQSNLRFCLDVVCAYVRAR
jgi:hypothetical protein